MKTATDNRPVELVQRTIRVGDTILTGGTDLISRIIQTGSKSSFSHAAIVSGDNELTEAYDHALTPGESDDGIFQLTTEEFLARSGLRRIRIIRPHDVDQARIREVAQYLRGHSPGFPTVGMICLALCGVSGPVLRAVPRRLRDRWVQRQVRLAGDGTRRMHCAETVSRIYLAAGVAIRFRQPRLQLHIEHLDRSLRWPQPEQLPVLPRVASVGTWPGGRGPLSFGVQVNYALRSTVETWRERSSATDPLDATDLILPGDYARAEPFEVVVDLERTRDGWREVPVLTPRRPPRGLGSADAVA